MVRAGTGSIDAAYEYDAFGRTLRETGSYAASNSFRFSTKYSDSESGLIYYGLRYYAPRQGRFINRDPLEERGGLNLYGFVRNNPANRWDYLGLTGREVFDNHSGYGGDIQDMGASDIYGFGNMAVYSGGQYQGSIDSLSLNDHQAQAYQMSVYVPTSAEVDQANAQAAAAAIEAQGHAMAQQAMAPVAQAAVAQALSSAASAIVAFTNQMTDAYSSVLQSAASNAVATHTALIQEAAIQVAAVQAEAAVEAFAVETAALVAATPSVAATDPVGVALSNQTAQADVNFQPAAVASNSELQVGPNPGPDWGQFGKGLAQFAGGVGLAILTMVEVGSGVGAPLAALSAGTSATSMLAGISNMVAAFSPEQQLRQTVSNMPSTVPELAARAIGGQAAQDFVGFGEAVINLPQGFARALESTSRLDRLKSAEDLLQYVDKMQNMQPYVGPPYGPITQPEPKK